MKILVLGANGMAGHVVTQYLRELDHDVHPLARSARVFADTIQCDVRDQGRLANIVRNGHYDAIVNCVGLLIAQSESDPALAVYVNSLLPHSLAAALHGASGRLVHLSTDCVFSGEAGPYSPSSRYDGQRFYDRSKALGEVINDRDLTIRMSIIGPELKAEGSGLLHWFLSHREGDIVRGFPNALWSGITTLELARLIAQLLSSEARGLLQVAPTEHISKHELLVTLNEVFEMGVHVHPDPSVNVDKRLIPSPELESWARPYPLMLEDMKDWMCVYADWYKHYSVVRRAAH